MPSLLQRVRRGSETPQDPPSSSQRKRGSIDSVPASPSKGFGKNVMALFINDTEAGGLKKRLSLSSPSALFGKQDPAPSTTPREPSFPITAEPQSATWVKEHNENQTRRSSLTPDTMAAQQGGQGEHPTAWPVMVPNAASATMPSPGRPSISHDSGYGSVELAEKPPRAPVMIEMPPSPFAHVSSPSQPSAAPHPSTPRPGMTGRQSSFSVIHSPPMPRPIANLPTLGGPSNVPPSPGWGKSVSQPSTPGGFSFNAILQNKLQEQAARSPELDEVDVRKARRTMPVMLREPSVKPSPDEREGGEAGDDDDDDDDDDDESETENEDVEDDSEEEEEPDASPTPTPNRKGKGKGKSRMRANTMDPLQEEAGPSSPPRSPKALADRRNLPSPHLGSMPPSPPLTSTWSMPTPKGTPAQSTWTQFQSLTPGTPKGSLAAGSSKAPIPQVSQTPAMERESYFGTPSPRTGGDEVSSGTDESPMPRPPAATGPLRTPGRPQTAARPSLYSRPSRSMVDLASPQADSSASLPTGHGRVEMPPAGPSTALPTPGLEWAKPPPTPAVSSGQTPFFAKRKDVPTPVTRRRSMDDMHKSPPAYVLPDASSGFPQPREDEGKERLPKYWCGVHIEGTLARKMEFSSPGVQSRDRSWKKAYFILHGTSLYVYKHDVHKFPVKASDGLPTAVPDVALAESAEFLHVHHPSERRASLNAPAPVATAQRRGSGADAVVRKPSDPSRLNASSEPASAGSRRSTVSVASTSSPSDVKDATLFTTAPRLPPPAPASNQSNIAAHLPFHTNYLIKQYTLQNAESGLAADYVKKKNVVRVRAQGEQFLLQTEGAKDVVNWIEAFQAATNVALDLDCRPMPKIITLPRRRRRRRPDGQPLPPSDANPNTTDTPEGNAAAVAAAEAASRAAAERMDTLLEEDQRATA